MVKGYGRLPKANPVVVKTRHGTITGTRTNLTNGSTEVGTVTNWRDDLNVSVNGYPTPHPFNAAHMTMRGSIIRGKLGAARFNDWKGGNYDSSITVNNIEPVSDYYSALMSRTNPARTAVKLPAFIFELKDLPDMLRQAGRVAKHIKHGQSWSYLIRTKTGERDMAAANLAIQFGWRPFVQDLWRIATLQDAVDQRRKELEALYDKGLYKRIKLGSAMTQTSVSRTINSDLAASITISGLRTDTADAWGTVTWKPQGAFPPIVPSDGQLRKRLVGFTPDAILENVWEVLPWSWLVDWFIPIGNIISANNRVVGVPVGACAMVHRETKIQWQGTTIVQDINDPCTVTPGFYHGWQNARGVVSGPAVTTLFPILGANQLSILASLAITRGIIKR